MNICKEKSALIKELLKKYNNKHLSKLEKKHGINQGSKFLNNGIKWSYYTLKGYSIVITTEYSTIKDIEAAY